MALSLVAIIGVFAPDIVPLKLAKQRKSDVLWLARLAHEHHIGLVGRAAAFAMIALTAGRHHVIPGRRAATRSRQHMIDSQMRPARLRTAVLAGFAVARQHAAARARQPQAAGNPNIAYQPDDNRHVEREALCAQALLGGLNQLGFFLQE